jgi:hypothetical protein
MRVSTATVASTTGLVVLLAVACDQDRAVTAPLIPFAQLSDPSLKDPDNATKIFRIDFARVEEAFPLSRTDLLRITPENVAALSQEQIDQVYGRLSAGPIPAGVYRSDLFFTHGDSMRDRLEEIVGGIHGRVAGSLVDGLMLTVGFLWKDKLFDADRRVARTAVEDLAPLRALIDGPDTVPTMTIPRRGPLRLISPTNTVWLLFPAKVYCGQSLLDGRRESIIIDYNYNDEIEGYRNNPDRLLGRRGLGLRDEIRMVRPGFYLGRAYVGRMFLLNFTLYDAHLAERAAADFAGGKDPTEHCWTGEQVRRSPGTPR